MQKRGEKDRAIKRLSGREGERPYKGKDKKHRTASSPVAWRSKSGMVEQKKSTSIPLLALLVHLRDNGCDAWIFLNESVCQT
jgi:hypothetical protein